MSEYTEFGDFDAVAQLSGPRMRATFEQKFSEVIHKGLVGCLAVQAFRHVEHGEFSDAVLVAGRAAIGEDAVRRLPDGLAWLASGYGSGLSLQATVRGLALDLTGSINLDKGADASTNVPFGMTKYVDRVNHKVAVEREAGRLEGCYIEAYSKRLLDKVSQRPVSLCVIDTAVPYPTGVERLDRDSTNAIVSRAVYMVPDRRDQPIVGTLALRAVVPQQSEEAVSAGIAKLGVPPRSRSLMSRVGTVFNLATIFTVDTYASMGAFGHPVWTGTGGAGEVALNENVADELTVGDD